MACKAFLVLALLSSAASAHAASITAPFSGCVYIEDLKAANVGILYWELDGIYGMPIQAAAFAGDKPGCNPTTHHQRPLIIKGGTDALRNPTVDSLTIGFDWEKQATEQPCYRVFQPDIKIATANIFQGWLITYRDTQIPEQCKAQPKPPVVKPPVVVVTPPYVPPVEPDYPTPTPYAGPRLPQPKPFGDFPDEPDPPMPVPEPTTIVLLGSGLVAVARKVRRG